MNSDDDNTMDEDFQQLGSDNELGFELSDYEEQPQAEADSEKKKSLKGYSVITQEELKRDIKNMANEVMDSLSVSNEEAILLLRYFNWEKEKLFDAWFADDSSKIAAAAGVFLLEDEPSSHLDEEKISCMICMDEFRMDECYGLPCAHLYCSTCWKEYIDNRFTTEQPEEFLHTRCPWPKCIAMCGNACYKKFLSQENFEKVEKSILASFVERKNRHWCPSPFCTNAIETVVADHRTPIECTCKFRFCFLCNDYGIGDHAPSDCEQVEKWLKKAAAESENVLWMQANTKKCPKCLSHIEKNGGCMHMSCNKCKHEFCWLCRSDWRKHASCNKNESAQNEDKQAVLAKNELEHYMHYYHRYEAHRAAMKIADEQRLKAGEKQDFIMDTFGEAVTNQDVKFIRGAAETLIRCRNLLQYSYVYAFYLSTAKVRKAEKDLFEHLQDGLEQQTNILSQKYEKDLSDIVDRKGKGILTFNSWKGEINNYINVCNKYMDNFVDGVVNKSLLTFEDDLSSDERYYYAQIQALEQMGLTRELTLPFLIKYEGNVDRVVATLFQ
jgi:ariadne-1